jgi:hypothetical protein
MWIQFVKDFIKNHPHVSWKEAMKLCKPLYAIHKKKMRLQTRKRGVPHDPERDLKDSVQKATLTKKQRQIIKDECNIQSVRDPSALKIYTPRRR